MIVSNIKRGRRYETNPERKLFYIGAYKKVEIELLNVARFFFKASWKAETFPICFKTSFA